jgi:hypothetical protein
MSDELVPLNPGEFLLYQTEDGRMRIQVRVEGETVWLSQRDMAHLFQTTPQNVTMHIASLYEEGELVEAATCKEYLQVRSEGERQVQRSVKHYNLDVIISVGYRVKSLQGTQFRIWATQRLREYLIKGFTLDDDRLKKGGGGGYFDELLDRIRDIRSSERVFWRKVLDIYATSIDYDSKAEASQLFFRTVQNKMHWAAHGQTAAEVVHARADAGQPNMGLTSWAGARPRKADVGIAKNYLTQDEIQALNLIVSAYLDFAELQAHSRKPMYMRDWIAKLDAFIRLSDRDLLTHAGKISHESAVTKAEAEFETFRQVQAALPAPVDQHFDEVVDKVKRLEQTAPPKKPRARKREDKEAADGK